MAQQIIDIGTIANDGTGDPLRTAFTKTNDNFTELYTVTNALGTAANSNVGDFAPALGADDNYVTDAEKVVIGNTSGTNTGDQDLSGYVESDPTGVTGADQITNMMSLTQAEYDAIGTPNASTLYVITA